MSHTAGDNFSSFTQGQGPEHLVDNWWEKEPDPAVVSPTHYIQVCSGKPICNFASQEAPGLAKEIDKIFMKLELPTDVSIGISGCPRNCREVDERDFGAFPKAQGWTIFFGGNPYRSRVGDVLAENLTGSEVIKLAQKCFQYYTAHAQEQENTTNFIDRIGFLKFQKDVL